MKTPAIEPLTDGEERIMQMLWSLGEGTVNDILAVIPEPKPKYTTVATFIKILEIKATSPTAARERAMSSHRSSHAKRSPAGRCS